INTASAQRRPAEQSTQFNHLVVLEQLASHGVLLLLCRHRGGSAPLHPRRARPRLLRQAQRRRRQEGPLPPRAPARPRRAASFFPAGHRPAVLRLRLPSSPSRHPASSRGQFQLQQHQCRRRRLARRQGDVVRRAQGRRARRQRRRLRVQERQPATLLRHDLVRQRAALQGRQGMRLMLPDTVRVGGPPGVLRRAGDGDHHGHELLPGVPLPLRPQRHRLRRHGQGRPQRRAPPRRHHRHAVQEHGSNPYYLAILVEYENGDGDVDQVDIMQSRPDVAGEGGMAPTGEWVPMTESWGSIWRMDTRRPMQGPFSLRITNESGKTLVADQVIPADWEPNEIYSSIIQFD
uniref:Expansin-like CBD domain-containing protein n=1 Tax=Aegilops tauschii subsp. strangulata TaxID=200361 RepID=A0A453J9W4_AEGTS